MDAYPRVGQITDGRRLPSLLLGQVEGSTQLPQLEASMIWLAVLLVIAWLLGWGVFHVAGGLIHILLVIAVVVFLLNFISGRRTV